MTPAERKFSYKVVAFAIGILVAGWVGMWIMGWDSKVAGQVIPPQPAPVTNYAAYPAPEVSTLAEGCDANDVFGVTFSVNAGPTVTALADLGPLEAGDTVTMSWTDISPECDPPGTDQSAIVLALKSSTGPTFDPSVDQLLEVPYGLDWMVGGQGGTLSYELPSLTDDSLAGCFFQLDAIVGLPLQIVGPNGSYYNYDRPWDLLIDAVNGAYENCDVPEETTTTTVPETTTTTTGPPETTTTTVPTTTTSEPENPGHGPDCDDPTGLNELEVAYCLQVPPTVPPTSGVGVSGEDAAGNPPPEPAALPASKQLAATGGSVDLWLAAVILLFCFGWLARLHTEERS